MNGSTAMKHNSDQVAAAHITVHDLAQPLNVIRLTAANIRSRLMSKLASAEADFLAQKLDKIDRQIERTAALLDQLHAPADHADEQGI